MNTLHSDTVVCSLTIYCDQEEYLCNDRRDLLGLENPELDNTRRCEVDLAYTFCQLQKGSSAAGPPQRLRFQVVRLAVPEPPH